MGGAKEEEAKGEGEKGTWGGGQEPARARLAETRQKEVLLPSETTAFA